MKTKQQVLEWFSERMAINKDAAETIIKILNYWGIYDVYVRYMSDGICTNEEVISLDKFCDWFHGRLESENNMQSNGELLPVLMDKRMKLYRVTLRGMTYNSTGVAYGSSYVIAENSDEAYKKVRKFLDENDLGFSKDRELDKVELIADSYRYTDTGYLLHL